MQSEIVEQAYQIKNSIDEIDTLIDDLRSSDAQVLLETYKSINIILKGQLTCLSKKPALRVVEE